MNTFSTEYIAIQKINEGIVTQVSDAVVVEEPLEIQVDYSTATGRMIKNVAITMRTPGHDAELAAGFLFTEGVVKNAASIKEIIQSHTNDNRVRVVLQQGIQPILYSTARNFYSTSSCGVCGKASIEALRTTPAYTSGAADMIVQSAVLFQLQDKMKKQQAVFEETGGIHASALFDTTGNFIMLREDVGRHNALDKLIGAALLDDRLPLNNGILFLSGRASFELLQKAAMAGIQLVAAVGAPSSLAVQLAKEYNISLVGFLKSNRFNIYSGKERIRTSPQPSS
jgi:FdhD protein